jgi:hypothetical protein
MTVVTGLMAIIVVAFMKPQKKVDGRVEAQVDTEEVPVTPVTPSSMFEK